MAPARDLYEILGVSRDASQEDIKRAYRRLARELHPDVSEHPESEERFKEIVGAYEILSDAEKRRQYDLFGQRGAESWPFGDITDVFEYFFGGGGFGTSRRPSRRTRTGRGEDVFAGVSLAFHDAAFGAHRDVEVETLVTCERCEGRGAEPGTSASRCHTCAGTGQVQEVRRSIFGTVMTAHPCSTCEGTGEEIAARCERCGGDGRVARRHTVAVDVPAGVSDGVELRVPGAGHAGRAGGASGDLYLSIAVEPSPVFERRGPDLFAVVDLPMSQAALGTELEVETIDGPVRIAVEPGTESGTVMRLRGKGIAHLGRRGRGDLFLTIQVETPKGLKKEQRRLLEQLAELRGEAPVERPPKAPLRRTSG